MRISINQRPGSSRNFGFTTQWDPSGVFVMSIEEGKNIFQTLNILGLRKLIEIGKEAIS